MLQRQLGPARFVARHERNGVRHVAMGERDLQACGGSDAGGDAGHDLNLNAGLTERIEFLAASAEDKGSPPFRRTTVSPASARWMRSVLISSCGTECAPLALPTGISSASRRA